MIIDIYIIYIIVILTFYLILYSINNGGVRIRYLWHNTFTLCYTTDTLYTTRSTIYY